VTEAGLLEQNTFYTHTRYVNVSQVPVPVPILLTHTHSCTCIHQQSVRDVCIHTLPDKLLM